MVPPVQFSFCRGSAVGASFGFLGRVHRYTARVAPAIRAGKGWRGRRELAPRCSATQLGASHARARTDSLCR